MLLDDIATYLTANSTRLTVGVNLTKGYMPATPATVTTLFETQGLPPIHVFSTGTGTRLYEQPGLMVHSRSTDYQTMRNTLQEVFVLLDGYANTGLPTSTGTHYAAINADQSPFDIGQDANDWHLGSVNFAVVKTTG